MPRFNIVFTYESTVDLSETDLIRMHDELVAAGVISASRSWKPREIIQTYCLRYKPEFAFQGRIVEPVEPLLCKAFEVK